MCWGLPASSHLQPPASSLFSFLLSLCSLSPSPSSPSQKLSVHSHFLWLLSLSPDLMRTIWGKEGGREGGGEAGKGPPLQPASFTPLRLCARPWHTLPQTPLTGSWWPGWGTLRARAQSRAGASEGDLCSRTMFLRLWELIGRGLPFPHAAPKTTKPTAKGPSHH